MKIKTILSTLLLLSVTGTLCAQYLDEPISLVGTPPQYRRQSLPKQQGYTLDLGKGNKLFIQRSNSYPGSKSGLTLLQPTKTLFDAVEKAYNQFKDSLQDPLTVKKLQYISYNGRVTTLINQKPATGETTYYIENGEMAIIKPLLDSITIAKVDSSNGHYRAAVMILTMRSLSEFSKIANATIVDRFIDSIEHAIPQDIARRPSYRSFIYGQYHMNKDNHFAGKVTIKKNVEYVLSLGLSADIQNIKNYFVPSAAVGINWNHYALQSKNSYHNYGLYWAPYFFFGKDLKGKTTTYRNDFLFATYNAYHSDQEDHIGLGVYLPLSIGYLIHRKGAFLEKHTFGINAFGVKYGNATLKPYIYFHDFFKGVSPSIQLSIGIGK
ncbi:hypothetical protein [Arachidicoccus terrestris]|uniref:hypothetical protein n=1 Tax=Arachidicoccus terrestris TaxID=2875539 RepID=UPI001CC4C556|nr:hypothetical protein [Arachidicoccus terrestris]UAY54624.1 hypothetical protein K9M52_14375 [Arachidicoccus terrestris]